MTEQQCIACGSQPLKKASVPGFKGTLQPYSEQVGESKWKGVSGILVYVCPECGYMSLHAEKPYLFKDDKWIAASCVYIGINARKKHMIANMSFILLGLEVCFTNHF